MPDFITHTVLLVVSIVFIAATVFKNTVFFPGIFLAFFGLAKSINYFMNEEKQI